MKKTLTSPGTMLTPLFESVDVWSEDGFDSLDTMKLGEVMVIIDDEKWTEKYRLNANLYVHVLSPRGAIGWAHIDNFKVFHENT